MMRSLLTPLVTAAFSESSRCLACGRLNPPKILQRYSSSASKHTDSRQEMFKKVMRNVPQPVVVVTTAKPVPPDSPDRPSSSVKRGVTCSSFTSVSLSPPIISFTMGQPSRMHNLLQETNKFAVHVLAQNQVNLAMHFSRPAQDDEDQFENIQHELNDQGTPILHDACSVLQCHTHSVREVGDHYVWYGAVQHAYTNGAVQLSPLLHYSRGFRSIGDETFLQAFETQTLPFEEWTHEAHLRMAWSYIRDLGKSDATPVIKEGIKKYNAQNLDKISRGYHETVTMFYISMVAMAIERSDSSDLTFEEFLAENRHLTDKQLLFQYYSDETINKKEAYTTFVLPDKKALS